MSDNISEKDKKDWETFLLNNEKLPIKNASLMKKIVEIKEAKTADGGRGAFYIYLRKKK